MLTSILSDIGQSNAFDDEHEGELSRLIFERSVATRDGSFALPDDAHINDQSPRPSGGERPHSLHDIVFGPTVSGDTKRHD